MKTKAILWGILAAGCVALPVYAQKDEPQVRLKWALEHYPEKYFDIAVDVMNKSLHAQTGGKFTVEFERKRFSDSNDRRNFRKNAIQLLKSESLGIAQVYSRHFAEADPLFEVLESPFLFRDEEHVTKFIKSDLGKKLLERLQNQGIRALAFTYSGGFQGLLSGQKLDFNSEGLFPRKTVRTEGITTFMSKAMGFVPKDFSPDRLAVGGNLHLIGSGKVEMTPGTCADVEFAYEEYKDQKRLHYYSSFHSVLFTFIAMKESVYQSLPKDYQVALQKAANEAADAERAAIIQDCKDTEAKLTRGEIKHPRITFHSVTKEQRAKINARFSKAYESYSKEQMDLVNQIRAIQ